MSIEKNLLVKDNEKKPEIVELITPCENSVARRGPVISSCKFKRMGTKWRIDKFWCCFDRTQSDKRCENCFDFLLFSLYFNVSRTSSSSHKLWIGHPQEPVECRVWQSYELEYRHEARAANFLAKWIRQQFGCRHKQWTKVNMHMQVGSGDVGSWDL